MKEPSKSDAHEDDFLSYEDESSSHGDIELMEIVTHLRSTKFVELDFERRPATGEEQVRFSRSMTEQPVNNDQIMTFNRWTNTFTLGPALSREVEMVSPQAQIESLVRPKPRVLTDEQQQLLSFEEENSTKGENTLMEITSHVRADDCFELKTERRAATAAEEERLRTAKQEGAAEKLWQNNVAIGDAFAREVAFRAESSNGSGGSARILSPCSAVDFATILKDLADDHRASQLEEHPVKSRWTYEDKAQSRDMAIILLSRYNPQSLIQLNGPRKKGTPTH